MLNLNSIKITKMLRPNFKLTNKILNSIAEIPAAREVILNASILPQWDVKLKKDAILNRAYHSTSIGEFLNL